MGNNLNAKLAAEEERHAKAEASLKQKQDDIVKGLKAQLDGAIAKAKAELARKDSELEERRKRNEAMVTSKDKEIAQWKSRVAAKEQELEDTIQALQKEEEANEKELKNQNALIRAEYDDKLARFEEALAAADAKILTSIAAKEAEWRELKKKELDELRAVLEAKMKAADEKAQAALDAVAIVMADKLAVITEKEALAAKYADLEAHLAKVLAGEMEAEAIAGSAAARVKKDMAAMERKKDSEIAQLQHENQVANDQKNRIRDEEQRAKEALKAKKDKEIDTLQKTLDLKGKEEARHLAEVAKDYEGKLKLREQEIAQLTAENQSLKDRVVEEDIEIDVVVEETVVVEEVVRT